MRRLLPLACLALGGCLVIDGIRPVAREAQQPPEEVSGPTGPTDQTIAGDFSVSGTVSGYWGSGLELLLGAEAMPIAQNGSFQFANRVSTYAVTVKTSPRGPAQSCTVQNGSGTATADVTDVNVVCTSIKDAPRVLFTDLAHGPKAAYVTLFGLGFGATPGSVTIGGEPATITRWGDAAVARELETIVVQPGAATPTGNQPIVVRVAGVDSEPFAYDVRASGTVHVKMPSDDIDATITAAANGDVIYLRAGTYTAKIGPAPYGSWLYIDQHKDIAVVAYPGETVIAQAPAIDATYTTTLTVNFDASPAIASEGKATIAKLRFIGDPKWAIYGTGGTRVVGNVFTITGASAACATSYTSVIGWGNSDGARILGNYFDATCDAIEPDGASDTANMEIAYNEVVGQTPRLVLLDSYTSVSMSNIRIHANFMHDEGGLASGQSQLISLQPGDLTSTALPQTVFVFNNIVRDCNREGIDVGGGTTNATPSLLQALVAHNSTYRNTSGGFGGEITTYAPEGTLRVVNNALVGQDACLTFQSGTPAALEEGNNYFACDDASSPSSNTLGWPASVISGAPPFVAPDFTPTAPAAIDHAVALPEVTHDYFGRSRRQGGAPDMGAVEAY